jgi:hypothetical protein
MNHIISKEQYLNVKTVWNTIKSHSSSDHILYNALRGFDLKRGFSPVINPIKLANGQKSFGSFRFSLSNLKQSFKAPVHYKNDKPESIELINKKYQDRLAALNVKYGVPFTPELVAILMEVFNAEH